MPLLFSQEKCAAIGKAGAPQRSRGPRVVVPTAVAKPQTGKSGTSGAGKPKGKKRSTATTSKASSPLPVSETKDAVKSASGTAQTEAEGVRRTIKSEARGAQKTVEKEAKGVQAAIKEETKDLRREAKEAQQAFESDAKDFQQAAENGAKDLQKTVERDARGVERTLKTEAKEIQQVVEKEAKELGSEVQEVQQVVAREAKELQQSFETEAQDFQQTAAREASKAFEQASEFQREVEGQAEQVQKAVERKAERTFQQASGAVRQAVERSGFTSRIPQLRDLNQESLMDNDPRRIGLVDILSDDGGPPRFISPYIPGVVPAAPKEELPLMLYLPGIDGTGLAASRQFPSLAVDFDLRALSVPGHDRTPFNELVNIVTDFLEREVSTSPPERPIYLLGESFGGVLALAVAAGRQDLVDRIVLVNPATSFPRSVWPRLGPLLPQIPKELYGAAPIALAPFLGNPLLLASFGVNRRAPIPVQLRQLRDGIQNLLPQLLAIADILPAPALSWKLNLLDEGSRVVEPLLKTVKQRVLLLASGADLLIPSAEEGPRLKDLLPRCRLKTQPGRSHALLQEAGVDLPRIMKEEGFYTTRRVMSAPIKSRSKATFGSAAPLELPTDRELELSTKETLGWLKRLTSPVFFSTASDGSVIKGLSGVPHARPMLFVGNHQTYALELGPMVEGLIRERKILPRGLAHPAIWAQGRSAGALASQVNGSLDAADGPFASFMATYGAVPVGARNFFKLMQNGEAALLYPGGVREAYKGKNEKYKLLWPEREEFVRMAAKFGATIVPFAGVGSEDAVTMLADAEDIQRIPILGQRVARDARNSIPQARRGASATIPEETFIAPFSVPSGLPRFYYLFRKPITLSPEDLESEDKCEKVYLQVKSEVEAGIQYLLWSRERDPYKNPVRRLAFEASWGGKRQAPTFTP